MYYLSTKQNMWKGKRSYVIFKLFPFESMRKIRGSP